mgnify:FL=1|jgi:hypothetical protein
MIDEQENKIEWVHCNQCLRHTRHEVVTNRVLKESEDNPEFMIDWYTTYTLLECRGCGSMTLRRRVISEDIDFDETDYYPPQISRQIPRWHHELPTEFSSLMKEVYTALHANSTRLALMGARALVDLFMNSTIGDIGGFRQKLQKLVNDGYLSSKNREILEPALDAGHAATHRAHTPSAEDVGRVFDIVENLIQTLVLKEKAKELKKHTPKRKV